MDPVFIFLLATLFIFSSLVQAEPPKPTSHITIIGSVYCDVCFDNTFAKYSYFLPGVDVHVQCKFKASSPGTTEQIAFSVNRTTNKYGMYKLDIPSVDGVDCAEDPSIQTFCHANLIGSTISACNVPGLKSMSSEITVKSRQNNLCVYTLGALSYTPRTRNVTLCGKNKMDFNSSKFFLPLIPPYGFVWPPLPQLPPFPQFPPLPQLPPLPQFPPLPQLPPLPQFPPLPHLPPLPQFPPFTSSPFPKPPSLPFPFPPLPPFTPTPAQHSPPTPPSFNLGDPKTWIPNNPLLSSPPPPAFNLGDPRTWIPKNPLLSSPPPPAFNFQDPRTWLPHIPTSPPTNPNSHLP
ncbi:proline-rich protein 4-like [Forsythia ovata]|uniref:Proline-rich protein 4-like n=1 Tax=Forsythia ovata TaxID=205694 RepID=A0ABD1XED8_9LAMI